MIPDQGNYILSKALIRTASEERFKTVLVEDLYDYLDIFVRLHASYYQRIVYAGGPLLSCHFAVIHIADFALSYPYLECPLHKHD